MQRYTNKQVNGVCLPTNTAAVNRDNHTWGFTNQTNRWQCRVSGAIALSLAMSILAASQAMAGSFSFTKIVDTRSDFSNVLDSAAINDRGTIAFIAAPNSTQTGVYVNDGTGITELINSNALLPLFKTTGETFLQAYRYLNINNKGTVAFVARVSFPSFIAEQIFVGQANSFTSRGQTGYNTSGSQYNSFNAIKLNDLDELAYVERDSFREGLDSTVVLTKADQPDVKIAYVRRIYSPNPGFYQINDTYVNNNSEVTFAGTKVSPNKIGIYTSNSGEINTLVEVDDPTSNYFLTGIPALSENDNGIFVLSSQNAIRLFNRATGELTTIADSTSSQFQRFGFLLDSVTANNAVSINNNNQVAFTATLNSGEKGIFTGADSTNDKVIATGDALESSTVIDLNFLRSELNNNGQIAFYARLADGTQGVYRADPVADAPPQPLPSPEDFAFSKILDTRTPISDSIGNLTRVDNVSIDGDSAVFQAVGSNGQRGFYKSSNGTLSTIADNNTAIPGGIGTFSSVDSAIISDSNVVFKGNIAGANFSFVPQGIYIKRGDTPLEVVVDRNTTIPSGTGNFTGFGSLGLYKNNVAFIGSGTSGQQGIYLSHNGSLQVVADTNTPIPGGIGNFSPNYFRSLLVNENNVAFSAEGASRQQGIYLYSNNALQVVVDRNTSIPGGTGNFSGNFSSNPFVLNGNNVAFVGEGVSGQQGIYISRDGSLQVVVDTNTPIPGGTGNFTRLTSPLFASNGSVVFTGFGADGQQGIYISRDGSLQVLVDTNTTVPGSTIKFSSFDKVLVDGDNVAFSASVNKQPLGVYAYIGSSLFKVADLSTKLDGTRISSLDFSSSALKGNSLTFSATFTDGTPAIIRADLITDKNS